jgi:hypothetical protein
MASVVFSEASGAAQQPVDRCRRSHAQFFGLSSPEQTGAVVAFHEGSELRTALSARLFIQIQKLSTTLCFDFCTELLPTFRATRDDNSYNIASGRWAAFATGGHVQTFKVLIEGWIVRR